MTRTVREEVSFPIGGYAFCFDLPAVIWVRRPFLEGKSISDQEREGSSSMT